MTKEVLILPGDGIGPEITAEAVKVLEALQKSDGLDIKMTHDLVGGAAYDVHGVPLADETLEKPNSLMRFCWARWAVISGSRWIFRFARKKDSCLYAPIWSCSLT